MNDISWEATPQAAQARLQAVRPTAYARTRNHLDGAVTGLSPYLTHGLLSLPQVLEHLQRQHRLHASHKLVYELGWREFFRHVWRHEGDAIFASLHAGPLPDDAYATELPADIRQARTGLAVVDEAVRTLYRSGGLHNHARMWLASYVVHLRKLHWRAGADWMVAHLLDGDLASNHLSWQWVAGTASHKPYLFNAENVRRHAPPSWHVDGSALDTGYDELDAIARQAGTIVAACPNHAGHAGHADSVAEPARLEGPPEDAGFTPPQPRAVDGREVWIVHPWCLREPPPGLLPVAVLDADHHRRWPWSERRWHFVATRMQALAGLRWIGRADALVQALSAARAVHGFDDPHLGALGSRLGLAPAPALWPEPGRRQRSFSAWWERVKGHTPDLADAAGTSMAPDARDQGRG